MRWVWILHLVCNLLDAAVEENEIMKLNQVLHTVRLSSLDIPEMPSQLLFLSEPRTL